MLNKVVDDGRVTDEEAYIFNDYVSGLEEECHIMYSVLDTLESLLNDKVTMYGRLGDLSRMAECQLILQKVQELRAQLGGDD
jgi:hypothetical protein